jgi:hypothetical protein
MNRKNRLSIFLSLACTALCHAENSKQTPGKVTVTQVEAADGSGRHFALVDADDNALKASLLQAMSKEFPGQVYVEAGKDGPKQGPILYAESHSGSMQHSKAGRDLGIGVAMCAGACLFVQAAGEDADKAQPDGLFVKVGDKVVTGGAAVLPCALGGVGLVFLGRSAIEAFLPGESESQSPKSTETILAEGRFRKLGSYAFDAALPAEDLKSQVLLYCASTI